MGQFSARQNYARC